MWPGKRERFLEGASSRFTLKRKLDGQGMKGILRANIYVPRQFADTILANLCFSWGEPTLRQQVALPNNIGLIAPQNSRRITVASYFLWLDRHTNQTRFANKNDIVMRHRANYNRKIFSPLNRSQHEGKKTSIPRLGGTYGFVIYSLWGSSGNLINVVE